MGDKFLERCSGARSVGSSEQLDSVEQSRSVEWLISVGILKPYTGPTNSDDELDKDGDSMVTPSLRSAMNKKYDPRCWMA